MKTTRLGLMFAAAAMLTASAGAEPVTQPAEAAAVSTDGAAWREAQALGVQPARLRSGAQWAYDTLDCPDCAAGINIAWADPECFVDGGVNCPYVFYPLPLNTTPTPFGDDVLQAPFYVDWLTDIFFDDYVGDADVWGDSDDMQPLIAFASLAWTYNVGDGQARTYILHYTWISDDGGTVFGEITWELTDQDNPTNFNILWTLSNGTLDVPLEVIDAFEISREGLICFDYENETLEGASDAGAFSVIAGGDLLDPAFPHPTELYSLGFNHPGRWGAGGLDDPNLDPLWDGEPGLSYLDVLNTGELVNWAFASDNGELAHAHPTRMGIPVDDNCEGDLDGDGDTDQADLGILLASFGVDDDGDLNGDGETDQQDLGILLGDFGCDAG